METENQEQYESLFEPISKIEETNHEKIDTETLSECECLKEVETKSNLELEQVKEPEPLKEVELSKEPELVKETEPVKDESKKSIWHYLNPLSWKFSKSKK